MRWLFDLVYLAAGVIYAPIALYQGLVLGKNRRGWLQRFGRVAARRPTEQRVWIHAVSLGEINATPKLVEALLDRLPDADLIFSTTTDTGFERAVQLYGGDRVYRFPLDFSVVVSGVLRRLRPTLIVLMELEVWPNLVRMADRSGIPVVVVNGRLTAHSTRRLGRIGFLTQSMFERLSWVGAQDEIIAARFREVGVPAERIEVTSSLKWDTALVANTVPGAEALAAALGLDRSRPIWVCGSTGPDEEPIVLDAYRRLAKRIDSNLPRLVIVPRKPERFAEVARLIRGSGFECVRRSACADGTTRPPLTDSSVLLGDTMGELRKFYSLADVVLVGRSLVPLGGSDVMEVAALGKPIIVGPHNENFQFAVDALHAADALRLVDSAESLAECVESIVTNVFAATELGQRARQVVIRNQGATTRTVEGILRAFRSGTPTRGEGPLGQPAAVTSSS